MRVRVLGAAAGGGFPQWNCGCPNCDAVRRGDPRVRARTQDSVALSVDGEAWHLVNASPDIHRQIAENPPLQPRSPRHSPIASILLTNGDLDHVLGLFSLRESWPLVLCATDAVRAGLEERNAIFRTLKRFPTQVTWQRLELGREVPLAGGALMVEARPVPGKLPVHLEGITTPSPEDNVGLWVREPASGKRVVYLGAAASLEGLLPALDGADCVLVDGTFWSSDELVAQGLSKARAEDMAHLPIGGDRGSLRKLATLRAGRKIFTHINNSNPILVDGSPEKRAVEEAGWEVAYDGMEIAP
jgi:pyrroloquinoline quinone biosynthesis protein B